MAGETATRELNFPKPGRVLTSVMLLLLTMWLAIAITGNWIGVSTSWVSYLTADTAAIWRGEVWRVLTAGLIHIASGTVAHIFSALLGLYFLGSSLESAWGGARFARFLAIATAISYGFQALVLGLVPESLAARLAPVGACFGAMPAVEALAIAWAYSFRGRTVLLFFVLPVSSTGLVMFVIGGSIMMLIAASYQPEGYIAPFAGMLAGYLFGGGTPSPIRRWYLQYRLNRLEAEVKSEKSERIKKAKGKGLRVIEGGGGKNDRRMLH